MAGQKTISSSYKPSPPPPPALPKYVVTQILPMTPDARGNYFQHGTLNGQPTYKHATLNWFLYKRSFGLKWSLGFPTAEEPTKLWISLANGILGQYNALDGVTGQAFVSAYV